MMDVMSRLVSPEEVTDLKEFLLTAGQGDRPYLLANDIRLGFEAFAVERGRPPAYLETSSLARFLRRIPELFSTDGCLWMCHRHAIARYRFYRCRPDGGDFEEITVEEYLDAKDHFVLGKAARLHRPPRIDFTPFHDFGPVMRDGKSIGGGIRFLNKHLSSSLFQEPKTWGRRLFGFISLHRINGHALLVNGDILRDAAEFLERIGVCLGWLGEMDGATDQREVMGRLKREGFEEGWGRDVARIRDTMTLARDLFAEPDADGLERFISRIPMISKIAIVSPHGWFGQRNVLGKPDTGGQVIYILDQVRALERQMTETLRLSGLELTPRILIVTRLIPDAGDTTCDQRMEKIFGTANAWILRVPFRDPDHGVVRQWISRFQIWPYLDRFAEDARHEILGEFQGRPDLIIGNYSDGNLVASLLSDRLDVIQCAIAHALEKTKYLFSDLYWDRMEKDYRFSIQFTADMVSMNKADFVVASTYQEIAGTEESIGQYESHQFFTMPGLYQAVGGVNLFTPKFNIVPPGVDEFLYFPHDEHERRVEGKTRQWERRLFSDQSDDLRGWLRDPSLPPLFTMARLDRIKNLGGLVEAFGRHPNLRERYNLILAGGATIHPDQSQDREERAEIEKILELVKRYDLGGSFRWLPGVEKADTGEVYRVIADRQGIFVQPALFEAFGLTILEAMISGLPTFGPQFGGPSEIIEDGVSGFLVNTSAPDLIAAAIWRFTEACGKDEGRWAEVSRNGIRRVRESFTWTLHAERLITLSKLYGFWRYAVAGQGMAKLDRYCDLLYHLLIRRRAEDMDPARCG